MEHKGHRWFAATYDWLIRGSERRELGRLRCRLVYCATGRVLEIGSGTGANLPYYPQAAQIVATEPDPFMLRRARRRSERERLPVEFHQVGAEELPFDDASFDTVVGTLVLCTVRDVPLALSQVRRVLKPGGKFIFIEHVRSNEPLPGRLQDLITPTWMWLGAGCHLNRRTLDRIREAGFRVLELEKGRLSVLPIVAGVASPSD